MKIFHKISIVGLIAILTVSSCGGSKFVKSPVDDIVRDLPSDEIFSIVLYDMDQKGNFSSTYYHKYQIIREVENDVTDIITDWKEVGEKEFTSNVDNMGMEIVARDSTGTLTKEAAPPGYNNYVGNKKYGQWEQRGGSSFWAFYGQYAFMSSMFRMTMFPVHRSYYNDWRGNYRGSGRTYYGPGGTGAGGRYYGTGSGYSRTNNPTSSWNSSRNSSFKSRVASRTSRSSGRSSSSRSRGGGTGK